MRVCCPGCVTCLFEKKKMMASVRSMQETVNKRFTQWCILVQTYNHNIVDHCDVFGAICVITQLANRNVEPLFELSIIINGLLKITQIWLKLHI